nr:GTP-binding protein [uncultured Psychroserpens sp.]
MPDNNDIVLRPRFKFNVTQDNTSILEVFEGTKNSQNEFIVSRIDDHIFIKIPKVKQHLWSPQLHLEVNENENKGSIIYGLFGPSPTVWTLFMFLHFIVAGLFIGFAIWAYVNWSLGNHYAIQLSATFFTIIIWFVLYFGGRLGKKTGMTQMHELHHFMRDTLRNNGIHAED